MTRKEINRMFPRVYRVCYCELQDLLSCKYKIGYNSGVYGWNFDVYVVDGVAITSGYRNMTGENIDSKILEKYKKKARAINENYSIKWEQRQKKIERLLHKFIEEIQK